ncbi:MAG: hypothetical protein EBZ77_07240 [Chitinophagia bacterium]|nr:hypothetical protein [Chitinophagia bacterium]
MALFSGSCVKETPATLNFGIDSVAAIYINHNDTSTVPMLVRFLAGNDKEAVSLTVTGLPAKVRLEKDTLTGYPTFTANFRFAADSAPIGLYPINIVTYSKSNGYRTYALNLGVVKNNCTQVMEGSYTGSNACKRTNYTYPVTAYMLSGTALQINNLGGYGTNTNATAVLDCNTNTVTIDQQNIGNGVTMKGYGTFSENKLTISYIALNTPGGYNDTCTAVLTR